MVFGVSLRFKLESSHHVSTWPRRQTGHSHFFQRFRPRACSSSSKPSDGTRYLAQKKRINFAELSTLNFSNNVETRFLPLQLSNYTLRATQQKRKERHTFETCFEAAYSRLFSRFSRLVETSCRRSVSRIQRFLVELLEKRKALLSLIDLTSCARMTCHARRELFVSKL